MKKFLTYLVIYAEGEFLVNIKVVLMPDCLLLPCYYILFNENAYLWMIVSKFEKKLMIDFSLSEDIWFWNS